MADFAKSWPSAALCAALGIVLLLALPGFIDDYTLIQVTIYFVMSMLAVSLGFIWGFWRILCFGQAAFFGLGAYSYAIAAINFDDTTVPFLLSIAIPALFALLLGYVIFFGRLSDVYMGVITLTVTLILFNLVNSTSGPEWRIGSAPLGGFNGIPSIPPLNWPGNPDDDHRRRAACSISRSGLLIFVYVGLRADRVAHRPGHRRDQGKRAARVAAWLRRAPVQVVRIHARRRDRRPRGLPVRELGRLHSARPFSAWRNRRRSSSGSSSAGPARCSDRLSAAC